MKRPIALISGCFDGPEGLHVGHRFILSEMRKFGNGECLTVVCLNSDAYLARKGPGRPLCGWEARCAALYQSGLVDEVVQVEDSPLEVIQTLQPAYIVVGRNDYTPEEVVGFEEAKAWGGQVVIISPDMGVSTTQLIQEKLKS